MVCPDLLEFPHGCPTLKILKTNDTARQIMARAVMDKSEAQGGRDAGAYSMGSSRGRSEKVTVEQRQRQGVSGRSTVRRPGTARGGPRGSRCLVWLRNRGPVRQTWGPRGRRSEKEQRRRFLPSFGQLSGDCEHTETTWRAGVAWVFRGLFRLLGETTLGGRREAGRGSGATLTARQVTGAWPGPRTGVRTRGQTLQGSKAEPIRCPGWFGVSARE